MINTVKLRNAVVYTLIAALVAWTGAAYLFSLASTAKAASAGDLIKMDGNPAVYYLGSNLKRYVFPNQKTFNTWYGDFSGVVTVSQSELESYAIGGNVVYRAGTRLGKITTDPKVYAVEPGGVLRWITSEQVATDLYGSNWNQMIDDIPDPFFVNYSVGSDVSSSSYPSGSLVKMSGSSDVYYIDGSTKRMVTAAGFSGNNFRDQFVIETSLDLSGLSTGSDITGSETDLVTTAGPEVGTPPTSSTGTLSVSLASDTPAAGTAVENAARLGYTKVNMTATGGDVTVDSLVVERTGLSQNSQFADIILLDVSNNTPVQLASQIGNEKNLSSDNLATFNEDIVVPNGQTKSVLIAANMGATLNAGESAALSLKSINLSGSATLTGSLPIVGNSMTMNGTIAIGTVTVAAGGQNPGASTQNVGTNDYVFSSLQVTAGSQEDIEVHHVTFTQKGTADDNDVINLELLVDGAVVGTVAAPVSDKVVFNLASPILIPEGNNKEFVLRGDINDGSGRTISFDIDDKIDVVAKGKTYGYFRIPTYPNSSKPYFNANDTSVAAGSITFSKGVLSSLNVAEGGNMQPLGAFKTTVQGESVEVTQLVIGVTVSGTGNVQDVSNLRIKNSSGVVIAGPIDPDTGGTSYDTATSTDTVTFPVGTNTYTIEGDLTNDFGANDTIQLSLSDPDGLMTAEGQTTGESITPTPTSDLSLDTVTVKVGSLNASVAATPSAQSVIVGQSGFTFANINLDASASGENIRVTQIAVKHTTSGGREDHIANLSFWDGSTQLFPIKQPTNQTGNVATTSFSFTNPIVVTKGANKTLTLKGDIVGGTADDTHAFGINGSSITAVGVDTANTITADVTSSDGRTMTIASTGKLTLAEDPSSPQSDSLIVGGASKVTIAELSLTAENEDLDLTDLHFTASAVNGGALNDEFSRIYLYDGSTEVASAVPTTTAAVTFENLNGKFMIPKGSNGKRLTVKVDTSNITNTKGDGNPGDSGDGVSLAVAEDAYSAKGTFSGSNLGPTLKQGTFTGKQFTVHRSVPTFEKLALASNTLFDGSGIPLYKFKLTADPKGDIGFYKTSFSVATSGVTLSSFELFEEPGTGSELNLTNDAARNVPADAYSSNLWVLDILFDTSNDGQGDIRTISAGSSKTFELRGSASGSSSGDTVSVSLLGDGSRNGTYPDLATGVDGDEQDDFIWSDLHYGSATSGSIAIAEWFNGYKVPGLNSTTTAQTLTR